jgi:hypothetical protein
MSARELVTCEKEIGRWTVRLNGLYITDFWSEVRARRVAMKLAAAIRSLQGQRP